MNYSFHDANINSIPELSGCRQSLPNGWQGYLLFWQKKFWEEGTNVHIFVPSRFIESLSSYLTCITCFYKLVLSL